MSIMIITIIMEKVTVTIIVMITMSTILSDDNHGYYDISMFLQIYEAVMLAHGNRDSKSSNNCSNMNNKPR